MKPRDYCCCAIPIINAGIYATLTEQFALAILVGVLSMATPSIVGAATPSFAPWILGSVCFVAAAVQVLGFLGVAKEKTVLYRRYVSMHIVVILGAFAVAVAWIIISASRHSTAQSNCINEFFTAGSGSTSEGETLCNIFPWVDVGIMGGLWVVLAAFHIYLYTVISSYGTSQRRDHDKYDQLNDPTQPFANDNIPMNNRNDPWDSRPSNDSMPSPVGGVGRGYNHLRQESATSMSDVMSHPHQHPNDGLSNPDYGYQSSYPPQGNNLTHPSHAYTQDPGPTPKYSDTFYDVPATNLHRPSRSQAHPAIHAAEGSFGRKAPRLTKAQPVGYDGTFIR